MTAEAALAYAPPSKKRADMVKVRGVRLPFFKFNRNPHVPIGGPKPIAEGSSCPCPCPRGRRRLIDRRELMRASVLRALLAGQVLAAGVAAYAEDPPGDSTSSPAITRRKRGRRRRASRGSSRTPTSGRATRERWPVTWSRARRPAASATMSAVASRSAHRPWRGCLPAPRRGDLGLGRDRRHAFPPPRDPGLVARTQVPGRHGAYRTDGPVVPDLIYATTSTINSLGREKDRD